MEANILRILVVLIGVALVAVIMLQQPKDGGMGAFTGGGGGSGASSTVFGAKGSGSFLFRLTAGLVLAFSITIVALVKVTNSDLGGSVLSAPVADAEALPGEAAINAGESPASGAEATSEEIPGEQSNTPASKEAIPGSATSATSPQTDDSITGGDATPVSESPSSN